MSAREDFKQQLIDRIAPQWSGLVHNQDDGRDSAERAIDSVLAALVPEIPFPGGQSQADYWRGAADRIEGKYAPGGSNMTAAVVTLLRRVGDALGDES